MLSNKAGKRHACVQRHFESASLFALLRALTTGVTGAGETGAQVPIAISNRQESLALEAWKMQHKTVLLLLERLATFWRSFMAKYFLLYLSKSMHCHA
jgi:NADH dehydrogenase FAD-containing subunit